MSLAKQRNLAFSKKLLSQCLNFFHVIFSGIHRRATNQEIRKAYKAKVKEWHPDKSTDPEAQAKFVEINQAYELLSDPDRRRLYDNQGVTEDSPNFRAVSEFSEKYIFVKKIREIEYDF